MKKIKNYLYLFLFIIVLLPINVKGSTGLIDIYTSSKNVVVGDSVTITVYCKSQIAIGTCEYTLDYNPDILKLTNGNVAVLDYTSDNQTTEPVINKYTCTIETTTTYNEKIEYTYIFTDNKLTSINEVKTSSKTTDETINTQIKTTYQTLSDQIKNLTNCTSTLNETDTSIELTNILDLNNADLSLVNNENYFNNQTDAETIKLNLTNKGYTCS